MGKSRIKTGGKWIEGKSLYVKDFREKDVEVHRWAKGRLRAMVYRDEIIGWHLILLHSSRRPTSEEVEEVRRALIPKTGEIFMAQILFPPESGVQIGKFAIHLHQVPEAPYEEIVKISCEGP